MTAAGITFDFHNTLVRCDRWFALETRELVPAFLRHQAAERGEGSDPTLEATGRDAYRRLRLAIIDHGDELDATACLAQVLHELGVPADATAIDRGLETLMRETFDDEVRPMAGAVETIRALRQTAVPLGIVSSAVYPPFLDWALGRFGILDAFAVVTTSAGAGFYKSRPEIYRLTASALGIDPARSVHVGDSLRFDVGGAGRAGLRTVWVRGDQPVPDDGPRADLTVADLTGLAPRLLALLATPCGHP